MLAAIGTDVALMHLHGIAEKVKFKGLKDRAQEKIDEVAAELGLTARPAGRPAGAATSGLDADGDPGARLRPAPVHASGFDEQLKPFVADADGKRRKDLPKPGAKDDPDAGARRRTSGSRR